MNDRRLDELFNQIKLEMIPAPDELVERTKMRVRRNPLIKYLMALSILINALMFTWTAYMVFFASISVEIKIIIGILSTSTSNFVIWLIYLYKTQVRNYMRNNLFKNI